MTAMDYSTTPVLQLPRQANPYPPGTVVEGEFTKKKWTGKGKVVHTSGQKLEGLFKDGMLMRGKITFPNGDTYEGELRRNKPHGRGKSTSIFEGEAFEYDGEWVDGEKHGYGVQTEPDGVYSGNFTNNMQSGHGKFTFNSGTVKDIEGKIVNGNWVGEITMTTTDGNVYIGELLDNFVMHGKGKLLDQNGALYYEGEFKHGKMHGEGKMNVYGTMRDVMFEDG
eukprot:CAMPEP_0185032140 /NCGR_PEP_ID=MMETSP1103-20130426/20037_1 /TAXON_ID=36769 /ORGANISM="Paraphysomonas bandaiensis, Strain Caron Lab Isolate" /LENGTH=222 /DNA_ID=CAMNT_0027567927 /DNA_START=59 /DNA_END=723 /DNA_ORIENTATION=-